MESDYISKKDKKAKMMGFTACEKVNKPNTHAIYRYGCNYCAEAHLIVMRDGHYTAVNMNSDDIEGSRLYCPHEVCPYKDKIEKYRNYADYDRHARAHWHKKIAIF